MLRPKWLARPVTIEQATLSRRDFGAAPFALLISYLPPKRGIYCVSIQIKPRDEDILDLIERHGLRRMEVYTDRHAEALRERQAAIAKQASAALEKEGTYYVFSDRSLSHAASYLWASIAATRTVRLNFGALLDGTEVSGSFDEVRWFCHELSHATDKLGLAIEAGAAFDSGEIKIFAPGTRFKPKKADTGTPPSEWGR